MVSVGFYRLKQMIFISHVLLAVGSFVTPDNASEFFISWDDKDWSVFGRKHIW